MSNKPEIVIHNARRHWLMPDGSHVPYIAGGSTTDGDNGSTGNNEGTPSESESKLKEAREDAAKYRTQLRELQEKSKDVDFDEYKTLKEGAKTAEEKAALARGDYDKLLGEKTSSLNEQIATGKAETEKWKGMYETKVVDEKVTALAKANNAVDSSDVLTIVKSKYSISVDDTGATKIMSGKELATDGSGNPLSIYDAVKGILDARPHLIKSADAGAGATSGTGKGAKPELTTAEKIKKGLKGR